MRNLLVLLGTLLLCTQLSVAQKIRGFDGSALKGPVHTERVQMAKVSNSTGQLIEGERTWVYINSYDEHGNLVKTFMFNSHGTPGRVEGWTLTYDDRGREIECLYDLDETLKYRAVTAYDDKGHRALKTFYSTNGSAYHFMEFVFDNRGNKIRETNLYAKSKVQDIMEKTYDDSGRLLETTITMPDGTIVEKSNFIYDRQGRETESTFYVQGGSTKLVTSYSYDESGNAAESRRYRNGKLMSRETFTYQFDSRGNWIKRNTVREIINDGKPLSELETHYRTITYY